MTPDELHERYVRCVERADRAVRAIGSSDPELVLAVLGMAVTAVLRGLPEAARERAMMAWMQRLAACVMLDSEDDEPERLH